MYIMYINVAEKTKYEERLYDLQWSYYDASICFIHW